MPRFPALEAQLLRSLEGQILRKFGRAAANAYGTVGEYTTFATMEKILKRQALRTIANGRLRSTQPLVNFGMKAFFQDAASVAFSEEMQAVGEAVQAISTSMSESIRGSKPRLYALHQAVAAQAQVATLRAYELRVLARAGDPYRVGDPQRLAQKLGQALERPDLSIVTTDGVFFGNIGMLDAVAAHWYRLNYGAGARANEGLAGHYEVTNTGNGVSILDLGAVRGIQNHNLNLLGQQIQRINDARPPSEPFTIPFGAWFDGGNKLVPWDAHGNGRDRFYPGGQARSLVQRTVSMSTPASHVAPFFQGPKMTQGIAGRHFLDAGIAYLAKNLPQLWTNEATRWLNQATKDGVRRGPLAQHFTPQGATRTQAAVALIRSRL